MEEGCVRGKKEREGGWVPHTRDGRQPHTQRLEGNGEKPT